MVHHQGKKISIDDDCVIKHSHKHCVYFRFLGVMAQDNSNRSLV